MDLYCPRCAEPWDQDTMHDVAEENARGYTPPLPSTVGAILPQPAVTYDAVIADFYQRGCEALGMKPCTDGHKLRAQASAALRDALGDDVDGIAAMLDEFEYLGLMDEPS